MNQQSKSFSSIQDKSGFSWPVDYLFRLFAPTEVNAIWMRLEQLMRRQMSGKKLLVVALACLLLGAVPGGLLIASCGTIWLFSRCLRPARYFLRKMKRDGTLDEIVFLLPHNDHDFPRAYVLGLYVSLAYSLIPWCCCYVTTRLTFHTRIWEHLAGALWVLWLGILYVTSRFFIVLTPINRVSSGVFSFVMVVMYGFSSVEMARSVTVEFNKSPTFAVFMAVGFVLFYMLFTIAIVRHAYLACFTNYLGNIRRVHSQEGMGKLSWLVQFR